MYVNLLSDHGEPGTSHSARFAPMTDSAGVRMNIYVVTKSIAVVQIS